MKQCTSREKMDCIFLTRETRDEFLQMVMIEPDKYGNDEYSIITEDNEEKFTISYCYGDKDTYYYNNWYVFKGLLWHKYSESDFGKNFELL